MRAASPPRQMERENEMIVISHRLVLFLLSIFLLAFLSHVPPLVSERFMLFLLGRLVHAGRHDLLLRLACLHAADIPLLIIAGDGLFNGFFQLPEKESILRRRIGDGDPLRTGAAGAARSAISDGCCIRTSSFEDEKLYRETAFPTAPLYRSGGGSARSGG